MEYVVVQSDTLYQLTEKVNQYGKMGWKPQGGISAIRERVSGPVYYIQAVWKENSTGQSSVQPVTESKWKRKAL